MDAGLNWEGTCDLIGFKVQWKQTEEYLFFGGVESAAKELKNTNQE